MELHGVGVGEQVLQLRANDGSAQLVTYEHGPAPGDWQRTFPGFLPPLLPQWRFVEPFSGVDISIFRPDPPPTLESADYAASVDQVMRIGGYLSEERTDEQTEIAVFWADGPGTFTPPGHWNQIAADVLLNRDSSLVESSRVFALLNLALADAGIASWNAKYEYDLWRPIDAIRRADEDGNPTTLQDDAWRPLLVSPPFPTYTSGHSTFSGAADAVLTALLGSDVSFVTTNDAMNAPGQRPLQSKLVIERSFANFTAAAEEAGLSRIYGGVHFDFDNTAGLAAGRGIGTYIVTDFLVPRSG
ncbi:MAG: vanadium-dependent haloperoxidase [Pirellulaceae bacterium]